MQMQHSQLLLNCCLCNVLLTCQWGSFSWCASPLLSGPSSRPRWPSTAEPSLETLCSSTRWRNTRWGWPAVRSDSALLHLHTTWSVHVNSHQGLCSVSNRRPVSVLLLKEKCKKHAWFWFWFWFYSSQGSWHRTGLLYISVSTSWNLQPFHYVCSLNAQERERRNYN